jgi:hypothetical protein
VTASAFASAFASEQRAKSFASSKVATARKVFGGKLQLTSSTSGLRGSTEYAGASQLPARSISVERGRAGSRTGALSKTGSQNGEFMDFELYDPYGNDDDPWMGLSSNPPDPLQRLTRSPLPYPEELGSPGAVVQARANTLLSRVGRGSREANLNALIDEPDNTVSRGESGKFKSERRSAAAGLPREA